MIGLEVHNNLTPGDTIKVGKTKYTFVNKYLGCKKTEVSIGITAKDTFINFLKKLPKKYMGHILYGMELKKKWWFFRKEEPIYILYLGIPNTKENPTFETNLTEAGIKINGLII